MIHKNNNAGWQEPFQFLKCHIQFYNQTLCAREKKTQAQALVTDRGPTLIVQVSKSVFKYGIKINAGENNKELCST